MPSTATITAFYTFVPLTKIRSAHVNNNFDVLRGHSLPINTDTQTSSNLTHDLGGDGHAWRGVYNQYGVMYQNTAAALPPSPPAGYMAMYFKNDGTLYTKTPAGAESAVGGSISGVSSGVLLGRYSSGAGASEEITIGPGLVLTSAGALALEDRVADYLQLGERRVTDIDNLVVMGTWVNGSDNGTFRKVNGSSGYQVPVGKKFKVIALSVLWPNATAQGVNLCYSDNDVGPSAATALTNPVYLYGDSTYLPVYNAGTADASTPFWITIHNFEVPAGKYVSIDGTTGTGPNAHFQVAGYEVDA